MIFQILTRHLKLISLDCFDHIEEKHYSVISSYCGKNYHNTFQPTKKVFLLFYFMNNLSLPLHKN